MIRHYRNCAALLVAVILLAPCGSRGQAPSEVTVTQDRTGNSGVSLDGTPLEQWIEEQKASGKVLSGTDASHIGVIENNGGEMVNVRRSTVIRDSVVLPPPHEEKKTSE